MARCSSPLSSRGLKSPSKNAAGGDEHTDRVLKLRLKDQAPFVQMVLKHLGLIRDKVEVEQRVTWEDIIVASREGER